MALASPSSDAWIGTWYPQTMQAIASIGGWGSDDGVGNQMPQMSSLDTIAVLGLITPNVVKAIDDYNTQYNGRPPSLAAVQSSAVDSNGLITIVGSDDKYVDSKMYIGFSPDSAEYGLVSETAWERFPDPSAPDWQGYQVYSVATVLYPTKSDEAAQVLIFVRQMIADYQSCVRASASAISANAADTTAACPVEDLSTFLTAIRKLCLDLDVLHSNPPINDFLGALRYALGKTSEFIGKAAADVAAEVGKEAGIVGGGLTEGFLANAGVLSIIVVGIVVHLFLH